MAEISDLKFLLQSKQFHQSCILLRRSCKNEFLHMHIFWSINYEATNSFYNTMNICVDKINS